MSEAIDDRGLDSATLRNAWIAAISGLSYVSWIAREFLHTGVSRDDLEAEGRIGLFDAALRFDPTRGVQFMTYASWWARRRMQTFVARHARVVRRPGSRPPAGRRREDVSIDDAVGAGTEQCWRDVLSDEKATPPLQSLLAREERTVIALLATELPALWHSILVRRFGLDGEPARTLAAIGDELGLSRERVRQIEVKALVRLRRRIEQHAGWTHEGARSPREITTAAARSPLTLSVVRHMSRNRSTPKIIPMPSGGTPTIPRISATTGSEPAGTPAVPMPPRTQIPTTTI
jgi:RNA polymerase sigma factor (sigma-70 family)